MKKAAKLFTAEELEELKNALALNPYIGDEIPGTGGIRKLRFGAKQKGKRGGSRVIYFVYDEDNPVFLITCFGKNEAFDLSPSEKKLFTAFARTIKVAAKDRRHR